MSFLAAIENFLHNLFEELTGRGRRDIYETVFLEEQYARLWRPDDDPFGEHEYAEEMFKFLSEQEAGGEDNCDTASDEESFICDEDVCPSCGYSLENGRCEECEKTSSERLFESNGGDDSDCC